MLWLYFTNTKIGSIQKRKAIYKTKRNEISRKVLEGVDEFFLLLRPPLVTKLAKLEWKSTGHLTGASEVEGRVTAVHSVTSEKGSEYLKGKHLSWLHSQKNILKPEHAFLTREKNLIQMLTIFFVTDLRHYLAEALMPFYVILPY